MAPRIQRKNLQRACTLYTAATRMASEQHLLYKISFQVIIISRFAYSVRFSIISYSVQILMNQANKINNKQYFLYMIKLLLKTTLHVYLHYKVAIRVLATFVQYFYTNTYFWLYLQNISDYYVYVYTNKRTVSLSSPGCRLSVAHSVQKRTFYYLII